MTWKLLVINDDPYLKTLYGTQIAKIKEQWEKRKYYELDSGFDLFVPKCPDTEDGHWVVEGKSTKFIPMGIKLVKYSDGFENTVESHPYFIFPRSSIWKKPVRLANSTGIIDAGYRGEIGVALDNIRDEPFVIEKGWRLVQACNTNLSPFQVEFTDSLDDTIRGEGGFGSTGQ